MFTCSLVTLAALSLGAQLPEPKASPGIQVAPETPPKVLFLTQSAGFLHSVVRRQSPDQLSHAERVLVEAAQGRIQIDCTQDCAEINAENLARYDAVIFYTTGELPLLEKDKVGFVNWVRKGGAFFGIHCAADTLYKYGPYMEMIGGAFDGHPWHQDVKIKVEDPLHPSTRHLGNTFDVTAEIYQFRDFSRDSVHVVLSLDNSSVDINRGRRADGDYALSWCKDYGRGRVFYAALGHREDLWTDGRFLEHVLSGIEWATGDDTFSRPAPETATVLFDGTDLSRWQHEDARPAEWRLADGAMEAVKGAGNLISKMQLEGDFLLHVEFFVPPTPETYEWQNRGNSGVFLQGRYEIQILDSLGRSMRSGDCGGVYGQHIPLIDACKPAGEWQSYDILFNSPRRAARGRKMSNARATVWHNGMRVLKGVELTGPTSSAMGADEPGIGPIMLEEAGHPVRFRNIWVDPR